MQCDPNKYLYYLNQLLNDYGLVKKNNVHIDIRESRKGEIIAISILYAKIAMNQKLTELTVNWEKGFVADKDYKVRYYSYHYQCKKPIRFDSHSKTKYRPHINDSDGNHYYYDDGLLLDSEDLNLVIMLHICFEIIQSSYSPLINIDHYNRIIAGVRRQIS